jgi:hypothetical protein
VIRSGSHIAFVSASLLLAAAPSFALPEKGIPLARGVVWTGVGLGASGYGGISFATRDALPMTRMEGSGWYHYKSWFVGGGAFALAMATPRDEARLFTARYEFFTSSAWELDDRSAFQVMWLVGGSKRDFYADTAIGAPPALHNSTAFGSGMLVSVGRRLGGAGALRLSGGGRWAWWMPSNAPGGLEWTWEVEPGVSTGLQEYWPRSGDVTKAWELSLRVPLEFTPQQVDLASLGDGRYVSGRWRAGLAWGLSVGF